MKIATSSPISSTEPTLNFAPRVESSRLSLTDIQPRRTDRALLVGQTGSGKTTLARQLLLALPERRHVVVLDYKGLLNWNEYERHTSLRSLAKSKYHRLLYRPTFQDSVNESNSALLWEWLYNRGHTTIYVDETAAITKGEIFPFFYGACLMRGREFGLEVWSATQRPKLIPQVVLSESENLYTFRLRLPQDRERVQSLGGVPAEDIAGLAKRSFYYSRQDGEIQGPLTLSFPRSNP